MVRPETEIELLPHSDLSDSALCYTNGWKSRPGLQRQFVRIPTETGRDAGS
jgi:hypothetical protein